jgi:hypothetical protein
VSVERWWYGNYYPRFASTRTAPRLLKALHASHYYFTVLALWLSTTVTDKDSEEQKLRRFWKKCVYKGRQAHPWRATRSMIGFCTMERLGYDCSSVLWTTAIAHTTPHHKRRSLSARTYPLALPPHADTTTLPGSSKDQRTDGFVEDP